MWQMNPVNCVLRRPAEKYSVHWQPDLLIIPNLACGMLVSIWWWNSTIKNVNPNEIDTALCIWWIVELPKQLKEFYAWMFKSILINFSSYILSTERLSCLNVETEWRCRGAMHKHLSVKMSSHLNVETKPRFSVFSFFTFWFIISR